MLVLSAMNVIYGQDYKCGVTRMVIPCGYMV